jgi:hypothetical protein
VERGRDEIGRRFAGLSTKHRHPFMRQALPFPFSVPLPRSHTRTRIPFNFLSLSYQARNCAHVKDRGSTVRLKVRPS